MTRMSLPVAMVGALAASAACAGAIGDHESAPEPGGAAGAAGTPGAPNVPGTPGSSMGSPGAPASCGPGGAAKTAPTPLRRLTQAEYENTVRDLFGAEALTAVTNVVSIADARAAHEFGVLAQGITSNHVLGYYQAADVLAAFLTATPARIATLAPCLGQTPLPGDCARGFIERAGRRVFRRPLTAGEVSGFLETYNQGQALGVPDGVRLVLFEMLQSPHFLYRAEIQGAPVPGASDQLRLNGYELAARLSYVTWGSTPDDRLLDTAGMGRLDTDAGLAAEVDRILDDARARAWIERFFAEWLEIDQLPPVAQSDAFLAGISRSGLGTDMRKEVLRFAIALALEGGGKGTYKDLMTSSISYVTSANLAKVYGVTPASGDGRLMLPAGEREGLLTRGALLVESEETTSPITRGALVRHKLLCAPIPPPDPASFPPNTIQPPPFDPNKTARQRWTEQTSAPVCAACHGQFNPLGFALENYDPIGRYRRTEPIIDPKTGKKVNELPIDANVDVQLGGRTVRVAGGVGLDAALAAEPSAQRCFAQQWVTFQSRVLEASQDACLVADLADTGARTGMREMFRRSLLAPGFRLWRSGP